MIIGSVYMNGTITLVIISCIILSIVGIILVFVLSNKKRHQKYDEELSTLEREKNLIISASILSELNKVESLINNDTLKMMWEDWKYRFKEIKDKEVPEISEEINDLEEYFITHNEKEIEKKIAEIELKIYYIKMRSQFLLREIREITLSEERNRETVTKLKTEYREIIQKYHNNPNDYKAISGPIELQFENIDKLFSAFELAMENNSYNEVGKIVKAMGDTIGNMRVIIEESPMILLLGTAIIPRKMSDLLKILSKMKKDGYVLDFLNLEYNVQESNKKIEDVLSRLNVLNVEDSILELKTISDYFDSIYNDFDKEKISKKLFEEYSRTLIVKISRLSKIAKNMYGKIEDIKYSYDLNENDVIIIDEINKELESILKDYDLIIESHRSKTFAYSKLTKEIEYINVRVSNVEQRLEIALRTLGSLKEDELRAHEQLDEIKEILKDSKNKMKAFKLPVVPKIYFVQLSEAYEAIKEIIKELDKKPISIKTLNIRVDTARDLVLKLYNTTNETIKTAKMAEVAIVYGNRYRPTNKDISLGLARAENAFLKGNFKSSLESAINAINIVEQGIYQKLLNTFQK